jgi:hypothetical protein
MPVAELPTEQWHAAFLRKKYVPQRNELEHASNQEEEPSHPT